MATLATLVAAIAIGQPSSPVPIRGRPAGFCGLVGSSFTAEADADPPRPRVGEPFAYGLTIRSGESSPIDRFVAPSLDAWRGLDRLFLVEGPPGVEREERSVRVVWRLRPRTEEVDRVPAALLATFDPEHGSFETLLVPRVPLEVRPAATEPPGPVDDPPRKPRESGIDPRWAVVGLLALVGLLPLLRRLRRAATGVPGRPSNPTPPSVRGSVAASIGPRERLGRVGREREDKPAPKANDAAAWSDVASWDRDELRGRLREALGRRWGVDARRLSTEELLATGDRDGEDPAVVEAARVALTSLDRLAFGPATDADREGGLAAGRRLAALIRPRL